MRRRGCSLQREGSRGVWECPGILAGRCPGDGRGQRPLHNRRSVIYTDLGPESTPQLPPLRGSADSAMGIIPGHSRDPYEIPVSYVRRPPCACAPASAAPGRCRCPGALRRHPHGAAALPSVRPRGGQHMARAMRIRREHAHGALLKTVRRATGVSRDTSGVRPRVRQPSASLPPTVSGTCGEGVTETRSR